MSNLEQVEKEIAVQINMLKLLSLDANKIIENPNEQELERTSKNIRDRVERVYSLKLQAQQAKLEKDVSVDEVQSWSQSISTQIEPYEDQLRKIDSIDKEIKDRNIDRERHIEQENEERKRRDRYQEELKLEEEKIKLRMRIEKKGREEVAKNEAEAKLQVKLPKLHITRFQGTYLDWTRFWSQFETEIDKTQLTPVAKFSYLKELVQPKVRTSIDALPLTSEGYNRAKAILQGKYGKVTEVTNAHIQCIISLPTIYNSNPKRIHEFYEILATNTQYLETIKTLKDIKGYVRSTLDKLPGIRADLIRLDEGWQDWEFPQLVEALRKWTERNPITESSQRTERPPGNKLFQATQSHVYKKECVYCESSQHNSIDCDKVKSREDRVKILKENRRCFNCTGLRHRIFECRSQKTCGKCQGKHHTSICNKDATSSNLLITETTKVCHPIVLVKVQGTKCRALLDTGAGASYASSDLLAAIKSKATRTDNKRIEMMMASVNKKLEVHKIEIESIDGAFKLPCDVNKVDQKILLQIPNPNYQNILANYQYLRDVEILDKDSKQELPIHLILGASEYTKIKMPIEPKMGKPGEPVAEKTRFGWTIMSSGVENDFSKILLLKTADADYKQLCDLDVLGIQDSKDHQSQIYENFKEQLTRSDEGWYETDLLWKSDHPTLQSHEKGSYGRLQNLLKKLKHDPQLFESYSQIIEEQIAEGIVEEAPKIPTGKVYYIPHKAVIRPDAETTKIRIVYDASAKESTSSPSLNDCLEIGPALQNKIWSVLTRNRTKSITLCGDMRKAFWQIRVRENQRDCLRFHWISDKDFNQIKVYRFTRALFGLTQSPFLLGATIECHLENVKEKYPANIIEDIKRELYIDDLISGGNTVEQVEKLKNTAIAIFKEAGFSLHKWHSNVEGLEERKSDIATEADSNENTTYAKEQLGAKSFETKILGLKWNKEKDMLSVAVPSAEEQTVVSKRLILRKLASIYDPLGMLSPVILQGKMIYREVCELKIGWDKDIPETIKKRWKRWEQNLPREISFPRSLVERETVVNKVHLHVFADASKEGTAAAIYIVAFHSKGVSQGLLSAKSRLSKRNLTIPRLELVAAQLATKLMKNTKNALELQVPVKYFGWSDSTVVLHWLRSNSAFKQFVSNRVNQIQEESYITWRHVPTDLNPADVASRGCNFQKLPSEWLKGPKWLSNKNEWPNDIITKSTNETEKEVKMIKEVLANTITEINELLTLLEKHNLKKFIRITTWISRFVKNCKGEKQEGPLTSEEIQNEMEKWIRVTQKEVEPTLTFQNDKETLNLKMNDKQIYVCCGRIQGAYPIYLPTKSLFSRKLIEDSHLKTLHGGVSLTMSHVRANYWIPRLRQSTKTVIHKCYGCKRFRATAYLQPPPGLLPTTRTEGNEVFKVVGVDYAGPIYYKKNSKELKSYILLFSCSQSRAIHIELTKSLTIEEFLICFKRFTARRGRPSIIYSDNAKTFKAAESWIKKVRNSEKFHSHLNDLNIHWRFNISRAPWWGGQFERLIGVVKQVLYRTISKSRLRFEELEEVLLDIESSLNNRPLSYLEDDIQMPVLTPNTLIFGQENYIPESEEIDTDDDCDIKRRLKYVKSCKERAWKRWTDDYVKSLRERHNLQGNSKISHVKEGAIVIVKGESKNRGTWCIGKVDKIIKSNDGIIRAVNVKCEKVILQRAIQHLFPLELSCDVSHTQTTKEENVRNEQVSHKRPRRNAAEISRILTRDQVNDEQEEPLIA